MKLCRDCKHCDWEKLWELVIEGSKCKNGFAWRRKNCRRIVAADSVEGEGCV